MAVRLAAGAPADALHGDGGIEGVGLVKSYGQVHAVRGVDISIAAGETVALLGPNGAGKTTTIDMLLGLAAPDSGSVSLFGLTPQRAVAEGRVGVMLQSGSLLGYLTVRELVTMVASLYPQALEVGHVLELSGVTDCAERQTVKLSGGQTQRVRFAMAMVANPDLLVLDEPTVALDVEGRRDFWTAMRAFAARGKTVVFATHYLEEADAYADRIILMARGQIVADGSPTEIASTVSGRTIRATLPDADLAELAVLAGVKSAECRGDTIVLVCGDSDAALRQLLATHPEARDIEVRGLGLEEAFFELTAADAVGAEDPARS